MTMLIQRRMMYKLFIVTGISFNLSAMENSPENILKKTYQDMRLSLRALDRSSSELESYIKQAQELQKTHNFSADIYCALCIRIVPDILGSAVAQRDVAKRVFTPHIDEVASNLPKNASVGVSYAQKIAQILENDVFYLAEAEVKFIMAQNVCEDIKKRAGI